MNAMASSKSFFSEIFLFLTPMFPSASPWGTLKVSRKQNLLFPLWPVIKCILNYIVFSKTKETCCHLTLSLSSSVVIYLFLCYLFRPLLFCHASCRRGISNYCKLPKVTRVVTFKIIKLWDSLFSGNRHCREQKNVI